MWQSVAVSANTEFMKQLAAHIAPALKAEGFRKRGTSFNRTVGEGVVHVIEYFMSPWGSGTFTAEVGVYIPGSFNDDIQPANWTRMHQCLLQWGVAYLMPAGEFRQFEPTLEEAAEAESAVLGPGLAQLDLYPDARHVLNDHYSSSIRKGFFNPLGSLEIGLIHLHLGETERAESEVTTFLSSRGSQPSKEYTEKLRRRLRELGLGHISVEPTRH